MARAANIATADAIALRVPSPSIPRRPPNEVKSIFARSSKFETIVL
jgi:hypothetical protein